jgi:hypothetical protein
MTTLPLLAQVAPAASLAGAAAHFASGLARIETAAAVAKEVFHAVTSSILHVLLLPVVHGGIVAVARHFKHEAGEKAAKIADDLAMEAGDVLADVAKEVL